jgi:hypothetical protein
MSISESADMVRAETTSTPDRGGRLTPGPAFIAIVVLSAAVWSAVVFGVIALVGAFR